MNDIKKELKRTLHGLLFPNNATVHYLKTFEYHFESIWNGQKTFEIRFNDRKFKCGDILVLCERRRKRDTGRKIVAIILHTLKNYEGIENGYIILSLLICRKISADQI